MTMHPDSTNAQESTRLLDSAGLRQRWQALLPRERRLLRTAAGLAAVAVLWWLGLQPALRIRQQAHSELPRLQAQLQTMQALQKQVAQLHTQTALEPAQAQALFAQACRTHGIPETVLQADGPTTVQMHGVPPQAVGLWLTELRTSAHVLPIRVQLRRDAQDLWSGTVQLQAH